MNNKRKPIKLFTWKHIMLISLAFIFGITFALYRDYKLKGYLEMGDLTSKILPVTPLFVIVLVVAYLGNRPRKQG